MRILIITIAGQRPDDMIMQVQNLRPGTHVEVIHVPLSFANKTLRKLLTAPHKWFQEVLKKSSRKTRLDVSFVLIYTEDQGLIPPDLHFNVPSRVITHVPNSQKEMKKFLDAVIAGHIAELGYIPKSKNLKVVSKPQVPRKKDKYLKKGSIPSDFHEPMITKLKADSIIQRYQILAENTIIAIDVRDWSHHPILEGYYIRNSAVKELLEELTGGNIAILDKTNILLDAQIFLKNNVNISEFKIPLEINKPVSGMFVSTRWNIEEYDDPDYYQAELVTHPKKVDDFPSTFIMESEDTIVLDDIELGYVETVDVEEAESGSTVVEFESPIPEIDTNYIVSREVNAMLDAPEEEEEEYEEEDEEKKIKKILVDEDAFLKEKEKILQQGKKMLEEGIISDSELDEKIGIDPSLFKKKGPKTIDLGMIKAKQKLHLPNKETASLAEAIPMVGIEEIINKAEIHSEGAKNIRLLGESTKNIYLYIYRDFIPSFVEELIPNYAYFSYLTGEMYRYGLFIMPIHIDVLDARIRTLLSSSKIKYKFLVSRDNYDVMQDMALQYNINIYEVPESTISINLFNRGRAVLLYGTPAVDDFYRNYQRQKKRSFDPMIAVYKIPQQIDPEQYIPYFDYLFEVRNGTEAILRLSRFDKNSHVVTYADLRPFVVE